MDFRNKVIAITGGASGIGFETATIMAKHGGKVIISDIKGEDGKRKVDELNSICENDPGHAHFIQADISDIDSIRRLISEIILAFSKIDILINCAGICSLSKIPDITPEEWDRVLNVNLRSAFFCSQEALKNMCEKRSGKIINIASAAGKIGGVAVGAHYSASKAAIICLTKSLALYAAQFSINVNCVCPGPTKTQLTESWGDKLNSKFAATIPFKRYARAEEISHAICFLASDKADYITGETLDVNGGLVMD